MWAPSGEQFELVRGDGAGVSRATITQVAAGIRSLSVAGVQLTEPIPVDAAPPKGCGIMLVPWPNRVADAAWRLDGARQLLAVTEPKRGNAIHGLLRYAPYTLLEREEHAVTLGAAIFPQLGYPFTLETSVRHELTGDGLATTHVIVNRGDRPAPVAVGAHPYLRVGDVPGDELTVTLAASTHFEVDDRMNPVAEVPVDGTEFDLRGGRRVADLDLDHGFGGVVTVDGVVEHSLTAPDGRRVVLWGDESVRYVQLFTPRDLPTRPPGEVAVAIEPMTAPADALNSGRGLRWLAPGERWQVRWGIRAVWQNGLACPSSSLGRATDF